MTNILSISVDIEVFPFSLVL